MVRHYHILAESKNLGEVITMAGWRWNKSMERIFKFKKLICQSKACFDVNVCFGKKKKMLNC